jgi:hypothetical protein
MRGLGIVAAILAGVAVLIHLVFLIGGGPLMYELGDAGMYLSRFGGLAMGSAVVLLALGACFAPRSAGPIQTHAHHGTWSGAHRLNSVRPISKGAFLTGLILPVAIWLPIMAFLGFVFIEGRGRDQEAAVLLAIPTSLLLLCPAIFQLVLLYRLWAAIADGRPRATPAQAVGFLFIPFFNIYWLFQAWYGWTQDYNRYVAERGIRVAPRSGGLAVATCIFGLLSGFPLFTPVAIILFFVLCNHAINGVNALAAATTNGAASDRMMPVEVEALASGSCAQNGGRSSRPLYHPAR